MPNTISASNALPEGRWAIVVSDYNDSITHRLLEGAVETLIAAGVPDEMIDVAHVPGGWEIPLAATQLADTEMYLAIITLGCVIKGETTHDEHLNRAISHQLMELSVDMSLPVAFGVLTCLNLEQAIQRAGGRVGNKGVEAAQAALAMVRLGESIANWDGA